MVDESNGHDHDPDNVRGECDGSGQLTAREHPESPRRQDSRHTRKEYLDSFPIGYV